MTNIINYYLVEFNAQFDLNTALAESNKLDFSLEKIHVVLQKYFTCLKSQQYQNRLFNPLSKQILFNMLNFFANLKQLNAEKNNEILWFEFAKRPRK